ncbi:MAG: HAD family hydrolase [Bacteroidota bacterium]
MAYRAICTDIDGTLLNGERELSDRTIACIRKLRDSVRVILASSRMPAAMRHLQADLGVTHEPLICYNGGYVIVPQPDAPAFRVVHSAEIPLSAVQAALDLTADTEVHVSLYYADEWFVPEMDYWAKREEHNTKVSPRVASGSEVVTHWGRQGVSAHKVMLMGPEAGIDRATAGLQAQFGELLHLYRSRPTYLEIADCSINKAIGLQKLLEHHYTFGLTEVIAFGDNYNDTDLLNAAGWGVAVANAKDAVKAVADEITLSGKEDGVAVALERLFAD